MSATLPSWREGHRERHNPTYQPRTSTRDLRPARPGLHLLRNAGRVVDAGGLWWLLVGGWRGVSWHGCLGQGWCLDAPSRDLPGARLR